jgi:hypothetical protein
MPDELNFALAELSIKHGYKHIFLYRENATDRLLSLNYAQKTGIWGSNQMGDAPVSESVFLEEIDTNKLLTHELMCRNKMKSIYDFIKNHDSLPLSISFENLYQSLSFEYSVELVILLFKRLNLSSNVLTTQSFRKILKRGAQGTKSDYMRFKGAIEFVESADKLPKFTFFSNQLFKVKYQNNKIVKVVVWKSLNGLVDNEFYLSGIFLTNEHRNLCVLDDEGQVVNALWNLHSPQVGKELPNIEGSEHCRFIFGPIIKRLSTHQLFIKNSSDDLPKLLLEIEFKGTV